MEYDVIVIGAGISGLTAASLLAKKNIKVCVIDAQYKPGGACGIFKREDNILEQGSAMIYGFGEEGFCPHRFVFNCLEEPIDIIKHNELYAINYEGHKIIFYEDLAKFIEELVKVFPKERENFKKFYEDMSKMYMKVIAEDPVFLSPDTVPKEKGAEKFKNHPLCYLKFLSYMNMSTEKLLKRYFKDPGVFKFFDKLTSTYCYTTVKETPAILSSIMFVDNHFGGSYYPAGSTLNLIGKLEKVIEENGGDMIYNKEVIQILQKDNKVLGIRLADGKVIRCSKIVNSGNVWDLYNKLLKGSADKKKIKWANSLAPTYTSVILYAVVRKEAIPQDTLPIEMLIGNKDKIDEGEITVYILSIDDKSICNEQYHVIEAIGPTFKLWPTSSNNYAQSAEYKKFKEREKNRVLDTLEKRFPGFKENLVFVELATPCSLKRYALKHNGATAGVKQQLGQHMLKRLNTKSEVEGLYNCGESTVMGTGTPAVTVSGISAANLILRDLDVEEYEYKEQMKQYVNIVKPPFISSTAGKTEMVNLANKCQFCEEPKCQEGCPYNVPIRDINRRIAAGNIYGAKKARGSNLSCISCKERKCEEYCIRNQFAEHVEIYKINSSL